MAKNPGKSLLLADRLTTIADDNQVGGHFDGSSARERDTGRKERVVVDIIKRELNPYALHKYREPTKAQDTWKPGTHFMRISLRDPIKTHIITRYEIDVNRYAPERDLVEKAFVGGGLVATDQVVNRGAAWDPNEIAKEAAEKMKEFLAQAADPDQIRGL